MGFRRYLSIAGYLLTALGSLLSSRKKKGAPQSGSENKQPELGKAPVSTPKDPFLGS